MLKITPLMGEVFQKQAFEHRSLNASKNNSYREMPLVSSLKKMGSGGHVVACNRMPLHSSMKDGGAGERRMESCRSIPASTQDPIQP